MTRCLLVFLSLLFSVLTFAQSISPGELMIHSTTKISCLYEVIEPNGVIRRFEGSGTGFYYQFEIDSFTVPCIVTNKHVVQNAILGQIQVSIADENGNPIYGDSEIIRINSFSESWIYHPDPDVDLCIMFSKPILDHLESIGRNPFIVSVNELLIPNESTWEALQVIEEVTMVGYPNGVYDDVNNVPIVRQGQTATPVTLDYKGKSEFMINISSIPGSSGSPIFLFNSGMYTSRNSIIGGSRIYFLGILYAGPVRSVEGVGNILIEDIPVNFETLTQLTMNLGLCIKSTRMKDFKQIIVKEMFREN